MIRALVLCLLAAPVWAQEPSPACDECTTPAEPLVPEAPVVMPVFDPAPRPRRHPHFMVELGGVFHELYGIPYGTTSLTLRGGVDYRHFGIYAEGMIEAGAALPRLPLEHLRAGFVMQYVNGRFRVGAGMRIGVILVQRATRSETDNGFTFSVHAMMSVDVFRWSHRAVYVGADFGFDVLAFPDNANGASDSDVSPIASLQLGVRL